MLLDQQALNVYRFWQAGAIAGRDARLLPQVLPFMLLGLILALANAPGLNALSPSPLVRPAALDAHLTVRDSRTAPAHGTVHWRVGRSR